MIPMTNIVKELHQFYRELRSYQGYLQKRKEQGLTDAQERYCESLRIKLIRQSGKLRDKITELTHKDTMERNQRQFDLWNTGLSSNRVSDICDVALSACIDVVNEAVGRLETNLQNISEDTSSQVNGDAIWRFNSMNLHPRVIDASRSLFDSGHYAQAIFEAFKEINNFVKEKAESGREGKDLMSFVFNEIAPIIKLNDLSSRSDKDEQEGFKFLFMGAMTGIRNPKAHDRIMQNDPFKTIEYLAFASLLMRRIEDGTVITRPRNHAV